MTKMPKVSPIKLNAALRDFTEEEKAIVKIIVKKDNSIRASKPKVSEDNPLTGKAAYVWRMVVFLVSPKSQHQCMPMSADFDLPAFDEDGVWRSPLAQAMAKTLKRVEDVIVDSVPKENRHGVNRWAKAIYG